MDIFELLEKYRAFNSLTDEEKVNHEDAKVYAKYNTTSASFNFDKYVRFETSVNATVKRTAIDSYLSSVIREGNGYLTYDILDEIILRYITILVAYTDVTFEDNKGVEAFDAICEMGLMDLILYSYEDRFTDASRLDDLLTTSLKRAIKDHNSIGGAMYRLNETFNDSINNLIDKINNSLSVNPDDIEKVANTLKNINTTMGEVQKIGAVGDIK